MASGGNWKYELYFSKDMKDQAEFHTLEQYDVSERFKKITGVDEKIRSIEAFKCPLSTVQLTSVILYHSFILFETDNWCWSIEKRGAGILIQRSKIRNRVMRFRLDEENQEEIFRSFPIKSCLKDKGKGTTWELINWLSKNDELNKPYNLLFRNCQKFAINVFDHIADRRKLRWFDSAFA